MNHAIRVAATAEFFNGISAVNGHLFDKVIVVLEEAFFAGDPEAVRKRQGAGNE